MVKNLKDFLSQINFKQSAILCSLGFFFSHSALGSLAEQRQKLNQINKCEQFNSSISFFCTNNHLLVQAQQKSKLFQNLSQQMNAGSSSLIQDDANRIKAVGGEAKVTTQQVREVCQEAANKCGQQCHNEAMELSSDPSQQQRVQQYQQISMKCGQELQATGQRTGMALSEIATVLASLAQVMQALGIGQKDNIGVADIKKPSDDPCEGQFADTLIECSGSSGPGSTRAGLTGGTVTGGISGNGDLLNAATQGEPDGDRKGFGKASTAGAGGGGGFMAGGTGMMGPGMGGLSSGSGGSSQEGDADIDSDIHRGYMGTGGGSAGGGGGGGPSGGRAAPFAGFSKSSLDSEEPGRVALERKLNKLTQDSSSRAPASTDGKNGPFQDNWTVINKAYKKNASSMFHQK